jgi:hypothetical protein
VLDGSCSTRGNVDLYKILVAKLVGRRSFERPKRRWEDNIKMDMKVVVVCEGAD